MEEVVPNSPSFRQKIGGNPWSFYQGEQNLKWWEWSITCDISSTWNSDAEIILAVPKQLLDLAYFSGFLNHHIVHQKLLPQTTDSETWGHSGRNVFTTGWSTRLQQVTATNPRGPLGLPSICVDSNPHLTNQLNEFLGRSKLRLGNQKTQGCWEYDPTIFTKT